MLSLPATAYEVDLLARSMRASDIEECELAARLSGRYSSDWSVQGDLKTALVRDPMWAGWHERGLVGLAGVATLPHMDGIGAIWFLGTDLADELIVPFTLMARRFIRMQSPYWLKMGNVLPQHMVRRRRWLEQLKFDFNDEQAHQLPQGLVAFWSQPALGPNDGVRPQ